MKQVHRLAVLCLLPLVAGCVVEASEKPIRATGPSTLLFAASERGGGWDVYVEELESGERTNLTRTAPTGSADADDYSPSLSHDAKLIAFTSTADHESDGSAADEIFVMARDGGEQRRLTDDDDADGPPEWTPDGRIAFTTCRFVEDAFPACRFDAISPDGTGRETIVAELGFAAGVTLSPDGTRIAYARYDKGLRPVGLFVRAVGRQEKEPVADGTGAQWSPDGHKIAFLSDRDRNGRCLFHDCVGNAAELYVMDADGSNQRRLTRTSETESFPAWTPDGEWVLVARIGDEDGDYDVHAIRPDGSCEVQVTDTEAWEWSASWIGPTDRISC
jgi:TolB protein